MKKSDREKFYNETKGRCWYCWRKIEYKEMQIDHIVPQRISWNSRYSTNNLMNNENNLLCSCRKCNHYKRAELLDNFRENIKTLHERLKKQYIFEVWLNFWITQINNWSWKFYFEIIWLEKFTKLGQVLEKIN